MLAVQRPETPQRLLSLVLVALLHAALLFAALHFMVATSSVVSRTPEYFLEIIIPPKSPASAPKPAPAEKPMIRPAAPGGAYSGVMPSYAPPVPAPDITGLGQALFGCAPENLMNLTPDQRAHCAALGGFTPPDDNRPAQPNSLVQDLARRQAEMAAKNAPGRVPCTSFTEVQTSPGGSSLVPMVNPACLAGGLINGFGPLNGLSK